MNIWRLGKSLLKKIIKVLIVIVMAYAVARFFVVFSDSRLTGTRAPYIQMLSSDSVIIHWLTEDNQLAVVHFGEDSSHMERIVLENSSSKNHIIKLTDLKPATLYYYQVGDLSSELVSDPEINWFYTHPDKVIPTRVWVIGDSGQPGEIQDKVRDAALSWMQENPLMTRADTEDEDIDPLINVWLALGDIAYRSGSNSQYQAALFDPYENQLANTSLWPVYGNHDDRRWTYFRIFDLPENAEAGGVASNTENYYAFEYSNIHFIVLDSQSSSRAADGEMANWLKEDLAKNTKPWIVVAFHHPPYTKGSHDSDDAGDSRGRLHEMRENILPIIEAAGVDLVLSGHSHMYERSYLMDCSYGGSDTFTMSNIVSTGLDNKNQEYLKPLGRKSHQGTIYIVAGSSAKVDNGRLDHPSHHVALKEPGSVLIDVIDNRLVARFINDKGEVKDEFSITKEKGYESGYQGCGNKIGS